MALARVTYTQSVSGNRNFSVPFAYIAKDHVKVLVNGVAVTFSWLSASSVQLTTAPAVGAKVEIRRVTERNNRLVDFTDGSTTTESQLDLSNTQFLYLAQEADDLAQESNAIALDAQEAAEEAITTANGAVTTANAATNTANTAKTTADNALAQAQSAVTTANQAKTTANTALSNANTAVTSATSAVNTANSANTKADSAVSTANSASATATAASNKATQALDTANGAVNTANAATNTANGAVTTANQAVSLANGASILAANAEAAAETAQTAAQDAQAAAQAASQSASQAVATAAAIQQNVEEIAGGDLSDFAKNSENLSGLLDKAAARVNLNLGNVDNTSDLNKPISAATQAALDGKAASSHTHAIADVTGLQTALDGKAASSHTHTIANVTGLQTALDGKAASSHTHTIANVTGLQTALDGKAASSHTHDWSQVTGKPSTYAPSAHTHNLNELVSSGDMTGEFRNTLGYRVKGDIGGAYVDWNTTRTTGLQVDCPTNIAAYMVWRATAWGQRHLAAMDVYAGGSSSSSVRVDMHVGTMTNAFFWNDGGNFVATGNVGAYSDIRLKTDIQVIPSALEKVKKIRGVTYLRKDTGARQVGVIAQEVQAVLPEAVMVGDDEQKTLQVAYGNLVGLLIEAIKELEAKVEELSNAAA